MKILVLDPFAGISGDMFLGALLDAGLGEGWLRGFVEGLEIGAVGLQIEQVDRCGISCRRVVFDTPDEPAHRHLPDVLDIVRQSGAHATVKEAASAAFDRLAAAEAAVHGIAKERVHFHEVGALDAILDIMCGIAGVRELGAEACYTRPVGVGRGRIEIAHGEFPLPAPATMKLLEGMRVRETGWAAECTTPTGASILATLTAGRPPPEEFVILASGYGAGSRNPEDHPNCLRLLLAEAVPEGGTGEHLLLLQSDIDDLPSEYVPAARKSLLDSGALDAVTLPVAMKKGRPGVRMEALVPEERLQEVLQALFRTTSTIGARYWRVVRPALPRREDVVEWRGQRIRRKRVRLPNGEEREKLEYDDIERAAHALGIEPYELKLEVQTTAGTAPREAGSDLQKTDGVERRETNP